MITYYGESFAVPVPSGLVWTAVILSLIFPIALYVLRAIGLFVLAKRREIKNAWLSFLPFVWIYIVCRLVSETKFLKSTVGKLAIVLTIIFTLTQVLTLVYDFFVYFPLVGNYLAGNEIIICEDSVYAKSQDAFTSYWVPDIWYKEGAFTLPYKDVYKMLRLLNVIYWISVPLDIISIIIELTLFLNLFKKYWPQRFVLAFMLSLFFNLSGIFIFIIRKKDPVDYNEYIRARYQQQYGPYGYYYGPRPPYGPYGNPNQQNPYSNEPAQKSPFEQYEDPANRTPEEPFSDYNDNNDRRDN